MFNGANFQGWKFQIKSLLMSCGMLDIVDGTRKNAGDGEAKKAWLKDNARAMYSISSSIDYEQLKPLLICSTAQEMWNKLTSIHEQKSTTNKLVMTPKFHE